MKLGILGDGQLALLMVKTFKSLQQLGIIKEEDEIWVLSPQGLKCPAYAEGAMIFTGSWDNPNDVEAFINSGIDRLTAEITHFNLTAIRELEKDGASIIHPHASTFALIQDKLAQKQHLQKTGIPIAKFVPVDNTCGFEQIATQLGDAFFLKTRGPARDGKGVIKIRSESEYIQALTKFGGECGLYAEQLQHAYKELSVIVTVGSKETIAYSVTESTQKDNTCYITETPACGIEPQITKRAKDFALAAVKHFKGNGTYVVDMFLTENDELLVNGVTPRLDNSCHYTLAGCNTSAYENHIRAILDQELGNPDISNNKYVIMVNLLGLANGEEGERLAAEQIDKARAMGGISVHYGKAARENRKLGHILFLGDTRDSVRKKLESYDSAAYEMLSEDPDSYTPAFSALDNDSLVQVYNVKADKNTNARLETKAKNVPV